MTTVTAMVPGPMHALVVSLSIVQKSDVNEVVNTIIARRNRFHYDTPAKRKEAGDYVRDWVLIPSTFEVSDTNMHILKDTSHRFALSIDEALVLLLYYSEAFGIDQ